MCDAAVNSLFADALLALDTPGVSAVAEVPSVVAVSAVYGVSAPAESLFLMFATVVSIFTVSCYPSLLGLWHPFCW